MINDMLVRMGMNAAPIFTDPRYYVKADLSEPIRQSVATIIAIWLREIRDLIELKILFMGIEDFRAEMILDCDRELHLL